jgi:short/branched chain acyl-CoA dehydrogenase
MDTRELTFNETAMAKLNAAEVANRAASANMRIHGGLGYTRESAMFYADAKILDIGEGTSEIQRNVIARALTTERR